MGLRYTAYKLLKTILFTVYTQGTPGLNSSFSPFIYLLTIVLKNWFCLIYLTYFSSLTVILGGCILYLVQLEDPGGISAALGRTAGTAGLL